MLNTLQTLMLMAGSVLGAPDPAGETDGGTLSVAVTANTARLMPYQVFELTFKHDNQYADPTWDVTIELRLRSPRGRRVSVGGFFYGSSRPQQPIIRPTDGREGAVALWPCQPADLWRARFAPDEPGEWHYDYVFRNPQGQSATGTGRFEVVQGRVKQRGFLRIDPENRYRLIFDDGTPFFPVGFQDGIFDNNHNGSVMDVCAIEGPFRLDRAAERPQPPPGAMFARGPSMGPLNGDVQFGRHARAGFNLWRFSPNNFSIHVFADPQNARRASLDHVRWEQARMVDELLEMTRKYEMCNFYGLFGYHRVFTQQPDDAEGMAKVKRLIKYSVDRWGAYVDIWELLNEQRADPRWFEIVVPYLKSIDPYHHPVTTSWERPELPGIDLNTPHWYGNEPELRSDHVTAERVGRDKRAGKPVIYGEQGNHRGREDLSAQGIGGVWDPGSARRMRVRLWTALFCEAALVFWETSYAKDGHLMNLWIGPEERQYVHALQDFSACLERGVRPFEVQPTGRQAAEVRAYGLRGPHTAAVYLHHAVCRQCRSLEAAGQEAEHRWDHRRGLVEGLEVVVDVPQAGKGYWYDPRTGAILGEFDAGGGRQTLEVPALEIDLALLVTPAAPPDSDRDGVPNHRDRDDDGDTVADAQDAWPLEREEWADADSDRIGDSLDADLDADGKGDDRNGNGLPDHEEPDWDGDGVPQTGTVPWDAFPRDPEEWRDTDGDGVGDRADADDDGDGYSDQEERRAGTDPLDPVRFPAVQ